ncbi:MAG TPA: hemerythrin domain-containing protein [Nocardioidaceae bacterium]|jgi:iron-sulfur cluster repair protein YtfE (RIC family)
MCNYCGCRAVAAVAELTDEHERIGNVAGDLEGAIDRGDLALAATLLADLRALLSPHLTVEEDGLFPLMAAREEFAEGIAVLYDDHDDIDGVLDQPSPDWSAVKRAIAQLHEHIDREEHGLFPAALATLTPEQWDAVDEARARVGSPVAVPTLTR